MNYGFLILGLVVLIGGCGGGGSDGAAVNEPPKITEAAVSPSELPFSGGTVTITAKATDDSGVASVTARVTGPAGTETVNLTLSEGTWRGSYAAPANSGSAAESYTVAIRATDTASAVSDPATRGFTVGGIPAPPPPPDL